MNLRSMSLALVALLSTAGCVTVPADPHRPGAAPSGLSRNMPAAQASTSATAPPLVHDVLGRTDGKPRNGDAEKGAKEPAPDPRPGAAAPHVRPETRDQQGHPAPGLPAPLRTRPPVRLADPHQPYDMRSVCAAGRGVASTDILDLCRTAYGR
ncbi:hypothetical protein G3I29_27340 [Streptomyces halstedii]|uniref:Lipoprotein n=2 Tax=Streptomyces halstedii TaxID=1944 RepID=A0A6N9U687_STRHA|nr:hypothetical protein [Streptomyces halstedii]